jgi:hypothetical protein
MNTTANTLLEASIREKRVNKNLTVVQPLWHEHRGYQNFKWARSMEILELVRYVTGLEALRQKKRAAHEKT